MSLTVHQDPYAVGPRRSLPPAGTLLAASNPWYARWFTHERPGPDTLATHVLFTGHGGWWTDRADSPRAVAVHCGPLRMLHGDPGRLDPAYLATLGRGQFSAPDRFLPLLARVFSTLMPWQRMVYAQQAAPRPVRLPDGFRVRPLTGHDEQRLGHLAPELRWIGETWESDRALTHGSRAWGAFAGEQLASVACTYLRGRDHEDVAVVTAPEFRSLGLGLACVTGVTAAVRARGRVATWTVPRSNGPSRALAAAAGFRPVHADIAYWAGPPV
ncbi:GNAT family N-acetyltransferase [Kitasatospora sp. NPDC049258]|uniref:GNAT family N-acetyltransferase n=1 Tax=Kitasatospora sp. NPDC049258 TaxID=3155394 RepID=UPI003416A778